ncbi:hypothetical protein D3C87_1774460 [compost metagenome]
MSKPMITVTGALSTFSTLPGLRHGCKRCLPEMLVTNTNLAGMQLTEVGAN